MRHQFIINPNVRTHTHTHQNLRAFCVGSTYWHVFGAWKEIREPTGNLRRPEKKMRFYVSNFRNIYFLNVYASLVKYPRWSTSCPVLAFGVSVYITSRKQAALHNTCTHQINISRRKIKEHNVTVAAYLSHAVAQQF